MGRRMIEKEIKRSVETNQERVILFAVMFGSVIVCLVLASLT